jgi:glycosyltransferase involved in cell wall biosynthesis
LRPVTTAVSDPPKQMFQGDVDLDVRADSPLPARLPAGCRTAVFVLGSCFHRTQGVRSVEVIAGGVATAATAHGMPRLDLYRALHPMLRGSGSATDQIDSASEDDPNLRSYRSGFWAIVPVVAPDSGGVELAVRASLHDGSTATAPLGFIEVAPGENGRPEAEGLPSAEVAIAMATFDPDIELFRRQVESIREQDLSDWVCVISDDCSPLQVVERMRSVIGDDPRFALSRSERRLGFYRNFERALEMTPVSARYVALADQDDRWYPEKLDRLVEGLGDARLVYSDQRVVDGHGRVLADTYWTDRRNNHTSLASLLIANTITGAASLFRRDLLQAALPFPETPGDQYHDQWLGLVALATGRIAYVDEPLYDYVQHERAALGHLAANTGRLFSGTLPEIAGRLYRGEWRRFFIGWRSAYFFAYQRLCLLASVLLLRCGDELGGRARRMLERFKRAERSPLAFAWLAARGARRWLGRNETLGAEGILARGILWRYVVAGLAARRSRPLPWTVAAYDASLPPAIGTAKGAVVGDEKTRRLARLIEPLELSVSADAPERVNLLIPEVELRHFFGGYITKFNLARKLAERGVRTRILTVDPTRPLPRGWQDQVSSYAGLAGVFDKVEVAFARDRDAPVEVSPDDAFIATTWWTAHIAHAALRSVRRERFLYLIQEYEPYTFPIGSASALAASTYEFPHLAMFSTAFLRDFFARRGYGVFAAGEAEGTRASLHFDNAITAVEPATAAEMAARDRKRLLFYARPEAHGARNMFELGLLALADAAGRGVLGREWDLHGVGTVEGRDRIQLVAGRHLDLLPKRDQAGYARMLAEHDVGLALMGTPHPSLVPLEMASAGMLTVTNTFETKTSEAMSAIAGNLIAVPPTLDGIVRGLETAVAGVDDHERRIAGAEVNWSRDWEDSLNDDVMSRVTELLAAT